MVGAAALYLSAHGGGLPRLAQAALQSVGGVDWSSADDPDGVKEPLLDVDAL